MKRLTIKDIAHHFNVSISTVSKALNDSYEISKKTKEKIQKFAKEHNYKPNFNALSLKSRKTKTIGMIIPNMLNFFFAQVFKGVEKTANKKGYKIITCISNESFYKEVETIEMLSNGSIDGFLLSMSKETEIKGSFNHISKMIDDGTPVVMFDRVAENVLCDKVIANNFEGGIDAVKHLYKTGNKKIGFVSTVSDLHIGKQRFLGYKKGLEYVGLPFNGDLVLNVLEKDYKKYEDILNPFIKKNKLDGIIVTGESIAVSVMKAAKKNGYKIPKNFSVIAFSNGILARHSSPKMTTISQHGELMGEIAADILIKRIEENLTTTSIKKIIKTDLVLRKSTKTLSE